MVKINGFISDIHGLDAVKSCDKCGINLRCDHGWSMSDGTNICRDEMKCNLRAADKHLTADKAKGILPRWRKA